MSIESLSSLKVSDLGRSSKDKPRALASEKSQPDAQPATQVSVIKAGSEESLAKAATFNAQGQTQSATSLNEKSAIEAYQSMLKDQQRQDIQLLLGVDTYV